ncbi:hypothetical protein CANCADRAFT_142717 [Tortispora caseinolytica NRRL Y-17796]|uniref:Vps52/Sac2 family protein n=1 Tax=Tortispora caseinolytica NRRL Y-17796 TaxID=767744 RepID=A0A1E4TD79_9ASCO|nr:hypothetical protein CANCADRAFT_142717 [Tortispora caseinolytica NRRL Y-17796]
MVSADPGSATAKVLELLGDDGSVDGIDTDRHALMLNLARALAAKDARLNNPVNSRAADSAGDTTHYNDLLDELRTVALSGRDAAAEVRDILAHFASNLRELSNGVEVLESRSQVLDQRLKLRKDVDATLQDIVSAVYLSPATVRNLCAGDVDERFVSSLQSLERAQTALAAESRPLFKESKAFTELTNVLELVSDKALEKARNYMIAQIRSLRKPGVDAQHIQITRFLKFRDVFSFLYKKNPTLANELRQAYLYTMRWYYHAHFDRYIKALCKLQTKTLTKSALLGSEDSGTRRALDLLTSTSSNDSTALSVTEMVNGGNNTMDPLVLGTRKSIINSSDPTVIPIAIAENNPSWYWMESGFRSFNIALMDNVSLEYQFVSEFFSDIKGGQWSKMVQEIFEPCFSSGNNYTLKLLSEPSPTIDAYGVLICIRLIQQFEFETQHRRIPALDGYFNNQFMILWPKFQHILDTHRESLAKHASRLNASKYGDLLKAGAPTQVTQRFSYMLEGLLSLCGTDAEFEPIASSLNRIRSDFESYLTKLSKLVTPGKKESDARQERFLYNNYLFVLTVIKDAEGNLAEQEKRHFEQLTSAYGMMQGQATEAETESSHNAAT